MPGSPIPGTNNSAATLRSSLQEREARLEEKERDVEERLSKLERRERQAAAAVGNLTNSEPLRESTDSEERVKALTEELEEKSKAFSEMSQQFQEQSESLALKRRTDKGSEAETEEDKERDAWTLEVVNAAHALMRSRPVVDANSSLTRAEAAIQMWLAANRKLGGEVEALKKKEGEGLLDLLGVARKRRRASEELKAETEEDKERGAWTLEVIDIAHTLIRNRPVIHANSSLTRAEAATQVWLAANRKLSDEVEALKKKEEEGLLELLRVPRKRRRTDKGSEAETEEDKERDAWILEPTAALLATVLGCLLSSNRVENLGSTLFQVPIFPIATARLSASLPQGHRLPFRGVSWLSSNRVKDLGSTPFQASIFPAATTQLSGDDWGSPTS
ncbi:hypothetical protein F5Y00DRAFT_264739 [Daldinia vernicosa]|uniref:uncharacterized protein n=1 Tax=Daldinia vernicosa TaxID=114800 RepID=UPI002008333E|nr:uncharacterized protein F5Y00DRAFT_264739 [Daldinia vernicosa]KAI0846195.1 hypothetical protein F5Y00DRAFT_264739 [Daldinia vernicosa]